MLVAELRCPFAIEIRDYRNFHNPFNNSGRNRVAIVSGACRNRVATELRQWQSRTSEPDIKGQY